MVGRPAAMALNEELILGAQYRSYDARVVMVSMSIF